MFQDILYYWKSILSVVLALVLGFGAGIGTMLYFKPAPETVIFGSESAQVGGSVMRALNSEDPILSFPLPPGAYSPLMRPVDLPNSDPWVFAYSNADLATMKTYYDSALNVTPWSIVSTNQLDGAVVYTVSVEGYSGDITLSSASAPGIKSVIQGVLSK
jgi:hypothetical protein